MRAMSVALAVAAQPISGVHSSSGVIPALVIGSLGVMGLIISQIIIGRREEKARSHELDRDQAARAYEHRAAAAYLQQFRYLERVGAYVAGVVPMGAGPAHTDPPFPSTDEQFDTQGDFAAFASSEALGLNDAWREVVNEIHKAVFIVNARDANPDAVPFMQAQEARSRLHLELRPREATARRVLRDRMALELQRAPSSADGNPRRAPRDDQVESTEVVCGAVTT